jgi:hypothetical protein
VVSARLSEGTLSSQRILREVPEARRTEPTRHLYEGKRYVKSEHTDVAKTFEKFQRAMRIAELRKEHA